MNNDEKKAMLEEVMQDKVMLDDEMLVNVAGGMVKPEGYAVLYKLVSQCKRVGRTKEECEDIVRYAWEHDCKFKNQFTDGTESDLNEAIYIIGVMW